MGKQSALSVGGVAVVLVVIIVVAGAGAYFALAQPSTTSSTSTSRTSTPESTLSSSQNSYSSARTSFSTTTTDTTTESTSALSTTTATTSTSTSQSCLNLTGSGFNFSNQSLFSVSNLFGNFTQMTIHEQIINGSNSQDANLSYTLVGEPFINGTTYYQTNFTISYVSAQVTTTQNATIWFLPNGTATKLTIGPMTVSSSYASLEALSFILPFTLITEIGSLFNMSIIPSSAYSIVNESSVMLGSVMVNETVYNFSTQFISMENNNCGGTSQVPFYKLVLGMGKIANSNQTIAVLLYEEMNSGGSNSTMALQVTSLTEA